MATISELVVKITADNSGLVKGTDEAGKSLNGVGDAAKGAGEKTGGLTSQFAAMKDTLVAAGVITAVAALGKTIYDSIQKYGEGELALKRLNAVAQMNGLEDGTKRISDLGMELQNLIGVDGDLVIQLGAELLAQGKSVAQTEKLIRAASDLSAVTGSDLSTSVRQLTNTYSGMAGMVGRVIPEIKDLSGEQLKAGGAIDIISEKYGGMTEQIADSVIPTTNRLKEANSDLKETFGKAFTPLYIELANGLAAAMRAILVPLDYMATHSFDRMFQEVAEAIFGFEGATTKAEKALAAQQAAIIEANRAAISYKEGVKNLAADVETLAATTEKLTDSELKNARSFLFAQMQKTTSMAQLTQAQKKLDVFDAELKARAKEREDKDRIDRLAKSKAAAEKEAKDRIENEKKTKEDVINQEDMIAKAKADAYGDAIVLSAKEKEQRIADAKEMNAKMQETFKNAIMSTKASFEALGEALAAGEDGWKAFGKAAIFTIAGIVEALGNELAAKAAAALVEAFAALASVIGAFAAPGLFSKAAILSAGAGAAWTSAGVLRGMANSFEKGTDFAPGGTSLVGEKGPELVNLPRGASVTPNWKTERNGNGGVSVVINSPVALNPSEAAEVFKKTARSLAFTGVI